MPELSELSSELAAAVAPYASAQAAVSSRSILAPPTGIPLKTRFLIPVGATGVWATHENAIAEMSETGWLYTAALRGMSCWILDERLEVLFDGTAWSSEGTSSRGTLSSSNKQMPARTTTGDGQRACDVAISQTPAGSISVAINGVLVPVGFDTKVGAACYFSSDGGYTEKAIPTAGDILYWQGSVAGYELDSLTDIIDFIYEIV